MSKISSRGRPRSFDEEAVLKEALVAFWRFGYENTSMAVLTEVTGLNKPSLYSCFGSKEELFKKAVALYVRLFVEQVAPGLKQTKLISALEDFYDRALEFATSHQSARGCLAVHGALTRNDESEFAKDVLLKVRISLEKLILDRIQKAVSEGDFPTKLDPNTFAKYLSCVHAGINIQVLSHTKKEELKEVIKLALRPLGIK